MSALEKYQKIRTQKLGIAGVLANVARQIFQRH
jgi:hypothetical protein